MNPQLNQPDKGPKQAIRQRIILTVISVILFALSLFILFNRQFIIDHFTVWRFQPSASVVALGQRAGLTDLGKFYLYASQTEINDRTAFNAACGDLQNEKTVVIGCYVHPEKRIFVFDVTDVQLDGVKETSAAHEMLHAAYDRLGDGEKTRVNNLLTAEKARVTDQRLLKLIKFYEESEPNDVVNELHSILGTEVKSLSAELETYYKRYFVDRQRVVALKDKYEQVFTELTNLQDQLVNDMNALAASINTRQKTYQQTLEVLNADIEAFNAWTNSSSSTQSQYNTRRAALQTRLVAMNAERDEINSAIDTYNEKKIKLDKLNVQASVLNHSIDSKLAPAPSLQ